MKSKIAIYLAGTIKKGHENSDETYWSDEDMAILRQELPSYELSFLNPANRTDCMYDQHSVFGRDMVQVTSADLIFVDARDRRGLGVGAEMMWAKVNAIPVLTWAPRDSHYYKIRTHVLDVPVEEWIHPFVESLSDKIVDDLVTGAKWIRETLLAGRATIKGRDHMLSAMQHYKQTQFAHDKPMQQLFGNHPELSGRVEIRVGVFS